MFSLSQYVLPTVPELDRLAYALLLKFQQAKRRLLQLQTYHSPVAAFAEAAAESGFLHYGFSPHSPIPVQSPCNMSFERVEEYLKEFRRLRDEYAGKLNLYCSMEIDYLGSDWGPSNPYFDTLPLDYRIGSVHFIPSAEGMVDVDGRFESFKGKMERFFFQRYQGGSE